MDGFNFLLHNFIIFQFFFNECFILLIRKKCVLLPEMGGLGLEIVLPLS